MVEAAGICDPAHCSACFQWGASAKRGVTLIQSHQCCAAALTEPGAIRKHLHDIRLPARAAVTRYQRTSLCPIRSARSLASATAGRTSSKRLFIGRVQGTPDAPWCLLYCLSARLLWEPYLEAFEVFSVIVQRGATRAESQPPLSPLRQSTTRSAGSVLLRYGSSSSRRR
jgi:hypothetical protein